LLGVHIWQRPSRLMQGRGRLLEKEKTPWQSVMTRWASPKMLFAMLKADHQRVRDLFQEYEAAQDQQAKRDIAEEAFVELEMHAQLEEQVFYPAVEDETDEQGQELVEESLQEHQAVKDLIEELREMGPDAKAFDTKFKEL
jgi:hemerythrin superfamily protein